MEFSPTRLDIWFIRQLTACLGRSRAFDLSVQSGVHHNVLGGIWFAIALFLLWVQAAREGNDRLRTRVLTICLGTVIAIVLALLAGALIHWPPPQQTHGLWDLYPKYIERNLNAHSFPSMSVTVYASVAAGVFSISAAGGTVLWLMVAVLVALPRLYLGGHFPSDIVVGALLGSAGFLLAKALEPTLVNFFSRQFQRGRPTAAAVVAQSAVFLWLFEVANEFREFTWLRYAVRYFFGI